MGFYLVFSSKVKHKACLYLPGLEESQFREKVSPTQLQGPVPMANGSEQGWQCRAKAKRRAGKVEVARGSPGSVL